MMLTQNGRTVYDRPQPVQSNWSEHVYCNGAIGRIRSRASAASGHHCARLGEIPTNQVIAVAADALLASPVEAVEIVPTAPIHSTRSTYSGSGQVIICSSVPGASKRWNNSHPSSMPAHNLHHLRRFMLPLMAAAKSATSSIYRQSMLRHRHSSPIAPGRCGKNPR